MQRFSWLTPLRCRLIFLLLLAGSLVTHLHYLHHGPLDLAGDEAHYWDWSRRLDLSYYSKGPLVALIIRASCAIFGETAPAVRYPALLLSGMTAVVGYLLTLKLFKSDRLALGVTVLNALVPLFVAGSLLMTIDPPFYFCWAAATYALTFALMDGRRWAWPVAGLLVGIGALAKLASLAWLPAMLIFPAIDRRSRRQLGTVGPWIAVALALVCTTPIFVWNAKHDWVTFRHVGKQTGVTAPADDDDETSAPKPHTALAAVGRMGECLGGQVAVVGPGIALFMIGGVVLAFGPGNAGDPNRRWLQMLAVFGVGFFLGTVLLSIRSKVQVNWPAPAYFTLLILAAYFLGTRLQNLQRWKPWRWWLWGTVLFGIIMQPVAHDFGMLFPVMRWGYRLAGKPFDATHMDPTNKLRGWKELGERVSAELKTMPPGSFILCDDYQQTAELAFYVDGQPITYCAGTYYSQPKRHTQYDIWPDRRLDTPTLIGHDAIVIGKGGGIHPDIVKAFDRVERLPTLDIMSHGQKIRSVTPYRCYGFKGMSRPSGPGTY